MSDFSQKGRKQEQGGVPLQQSFQVEIPTNVFFTAVKFIHIKNPNRLKRRPHGLCCGCKQTDALEWTTGYKSVIRYSVVCLQLQALNLPYHSHAKRFLAPMPRARIYMCERKMGFLQYADTGGRYFEKTGYASNFNCCYSIQIKVIYMSLNIPEMCISFLH